jgi:hypothetical protein
MEWCLECHRHPEEHLRPRSQVFSMTWQPSDEIDPETGKPSDQRTLGLKLMKEYGVRSLTSCSTCHR